MKLLPIGLLVSMLIVSCDIFCSKANFLYDDNHASNDSSVLTANVLFTNKILKKIKNIKILLIDDIYFNYHKKLKLTMNSFPCYSSRNQICRLSAFLTFF